MKKGANILLLCTLLWCAAIIGAPLMAVSGGFFEFLSVFLYKLFGVVCHQFDSRTFHLHANPFGVCIRCTAIYFGFLFGILAMRFSKNTVFQNYYVRILLLVTSLPMVIDGALPLTGWYEPTTISRLLTGAIFGFGISLILYNSLLEIITSLINSKVPKYESTT